MSVCRAGDEEMSQWVLCRDKVRWRESTAAQTWQRVPVFQPQSETSLTPQGMIIYNKCYDTYNICVIDIIMCIIMCIFKFEVFSTKRV